MARQLKGTLQDLHTTQLLHLINLAKKTGTLHVFEGVPTGRDIIMGDGETRRPEVVPGKEMARVSFREGKLTYAAINEQDNHLATMLHKANKLNDEQHRVIRQKTATADERALALALINQNYVTRDSVLQSIKQHAEDVVYEVMTWDREPFIFEEGEVAPPSKIPIQVELENVIIEGTRRTRELDKLVEELPNLDFALKFPEAPTDKFKGINLSVEEWRVVSFINPKNTIRQIAKACNMTDTEIRKIVVGLRNAGLVELIKPSTGEPPKKNAFGTQPSTAGANNANNARRPAPITAQQRPVIQRLIDRISRI